MTRTDKKVITLGFAENFVLSGTSAAVSKTLAAPLERVKLLLQVCTLLEDFFLLKLSLKDFSLFIHSFARLLFGRTLFWTTSLWSYTL